MMKPIGAVLDGPGSRAGLGGSPRADAGLRAGAGAGVGGVGASAGLPGRGRRARDPVRRGSRLAGTCEGAWWRPVARAEVRQVLLAAKRYELAGRQAGHRNGPLGHVGLEVLELLANLVSFRSGRLEPAITYLMGRLRRSKDAVVRALAALRTHGFLDWIRRHERVEVVENAPGPRVRQVSNAYRLSLPARAAQLLGHWLTPAGARASAGAGLSWRTQGPGASWAAPLPDDVVQEREERAAWLAEHKGALPLSELPLVEVEDDRLARVLGDLGRAVEAKARASRPVVASVPERESARRGELRSSSFQKGAIIS